MSLSVATHGFLTPNPARLPSRMASFKEGRCRTRLEEKPPWPHSVPVSSGLKCFDRFGSMRSIRTTLLCGGAPSKCIVYIVEYYMGIQMASNGNFWHTMLLGLPGWCPARVAGPNGLGERPAAHAPSSAAACPGRCWGRSGDASRVQIWAGTSGEHRRG